MTSLQNTPPPCMISTGNSTSTITITMQVEVIRMQKSGRIISRDLWEDFVICQSSGKVRRSCHANVQEDIQQIFIVANDI